MSNIRADDVVKQYVRDYPGESNMELLARFESTTPAKIEAKIKGMRRVPESYKNSFKLWDEQREELGVPKEIEMVELGKKEEFFDPDEFDGKRAEVAELAEFPETVHHFNFFWDS